MSNTRPSQAKLSRLDGRSLVIFGATGYIGGSVLMGIYSHFPNIKISAVIRKAEDAHALEKLGVKVICGDDEEIFRRAAAAHDIVVNCADADSVPLAKAIIEGLTTRARVHSGGRKPIYLHTSGTAVISTANDGTFHPETCNKIWDDRKVEDIKGIDKNRPHREVDLQVFGAGEEGLIDTFIIAPATIYGTGIGPVKYTSIQVPDMVRTALKHKQVLQVGDGTNVWNHVHIEDLVELYVLVLALALSGLDTEGPYGRFYFGSVGTHTWGAVAQELAKIMKRKGLIDTEEVKSVTLDEVPELVQVASTSRTASSRGLGLVWKPSKPGLMQSLEAEVDATVEQTQN